MRIQFFLMVSTLLSFVAHGETPVHTTGPNPDAIIVSQGAAEITLRDVDAFAAGIPKNKRGPVFYDPQRIDTILNGMLTNKQLAAEARELGLEKDPLVQARIELKNTQFLARLRTEALRKQIEANVPDLSQLAHERYIANPGKYTVRASVDVQHILIGTEDRSASEAKALAEKLYAELLAAPETFDAKVKKFSDDPSKSTNHGLIQDAASSKTVEEFRIAAGELADIGDISEPVKTTYGYHILKLVARTEAHNQAFDEVRDDLVKELSDEYVTKKIQAHVDQLRNTSLKANPDLVASLRTRYFEDPAAALSPAPASSAAQ